MTVIAKDSDLERPVAVWQARAGRHGSTVARTLSGVRSSPAEQGWHRASVHHGLFYDTTYTRAEMCQRERNKQ